VMARGSISHIALTVSEPERSTEFYNKVFEFIGFKRVEVPESIQQAMKTQGMGRTRLLDIDPTIEG
jgi:predicted enzyme related to lactoylglutathione lyase